MLVCVFPLHRVFWTDRLVDESWLFSSAVKSAVKVVFPAYGHLITDSDWREDEYQLWSFCAFIWMLIVFGVGQLRDILVFLEESSIRPTPVFLIGMFYFVTLMLIAAVGFGILVIFSIPTLSISLEIVILFVIATIELYMSRERNRRRLPTKRSIGIDPGVDTTVFVTLPAVAAFVILLMFILTNAGSMFYVPQWSQQFVAGASALELLLANMSVIMIRAVRA